MNEYVKYINESVYVIIGVKAILTKLIIHHDGILHPQGVVFLLQSFIRRLNIL